jgi:hypothetical protein
VVGGGWRWLAVVGGGWRWLAVVGGGWRWLAVVGGGWRWLAVVGGGWRRLGSGHLQGLPFATVLHLNGPGHDMPERLDDGSKEGLSDGQLLPSAAKYENNGALAVH